MTIMASLSTSLEFAQTLLIVGSFAGRKESPIISKGFPFLSS
jgi:hypothetical protein